MPSPLSLPPKDKKMEATKKNQSTSNNKYTSLLLSDLLQHQNPKSCPHHPSPFPSPTLYLNSYLARILRPHFSTPRLQPPQSHAVSRSSTNHRRSPSHPPPWHVGVHIVVRRLLLGPAWDWQEPLLVAPLLHRLWSCF